MLVALPQSPEMRRPDRYGEAARRARNRVLDRAVAAGVIGEDDAERAKADRMPTVRRDFPMLAPHLADAEVGAEQGAAGASPDAWTRRRRPASSSWCASTRPAWAERLSSALMVVDHQTGEVIAPRRLARLSRRRPFRRCRHDRRGALAGLHPEAADLRAGLRGRSRASGDTDRGPAGRASASTCRRTSTRAGTAPSPSAGAGAVAQHPGREGARGARPGQAARSRCSRSASRRYCRRARSRRWRSRWAASASSCATSRSLRGSGPRRRADCALLPARCDRRRRRPSAAPACCRRWRPGTSPISCAIAPAPANARPGRSPTRRAPPTASAMPGRSATTDAIPSPSGWAGPMVRRRPGLAGRVAAAPILFDAFARLTTRRAPLPSAPTGALRTPGSDLPPPLKRFRSGTEEAASGRFLEPMVQIAFPPDRSEIEVDDGETSTVVVKAEGECVEQDRRRRNAACQPWSRCTIGPAHPDGDGMAPVVANCPGIAEAIGGSRLVGDLPGPGVGRRGGVAQDIRDVPGCHRRQQACGGERAPSLAVHRAGRESAISPPPRANAA